MSNVLFSPQDELIGDGAGSRRALYDSFARELSGLGNERNRLNFAKFEHGQTRDVYLSALRVANVHDSKFEDESIYRVITLPELHREHMRISKFSALNEVQGGTSSVVSKIEATGLPLVQRRIWLFLVLLALVVGTVLGVSLAVDWVLHPVSAFLSAALVLVLAASTYFAHPESAKLKGRSVEPKIHVE